MNMKMLKATILIESCYNMKSKKHNFFGKFMALPLLKGLKPIYSEYREILLYLFFGGIAFFLNIFLFVGIDRVFQMNELVNNAICWVICVLFQFITNRTWVFEGCTDTFCDLAGQFLSFVGGRVFTLILEEVILAVFITWMGLNSLFIKLCAQIVVIVLNYLISKFWVFKNG